MIWTSTTSTTAITTNLATLKFIYQKMSILNKDQTESYIFPQMPATDEPRIFTVGMVIAHMFPGNAFEVDNVEAYSIPECGRDAQHDESRDTRRLVDFRAAHDNCQRVTGIPDSYHLQLAAHGPGGEEESSDGEKSTVYNAEEEDETRQRMIMSQPTSPVDNVITITNEDGDGAGGPQFLVDTST